MTFQAGMQKQSVQPARTSSREAGMQKQSVQPARTSSREADMNALCEENVIIRLGMKPGDPNIITISCSDEIGLACDLIRSIFEFGLDIVRADMSTDGKWCLLLFWVTPRQGPTQAIMWAQLKKRLSTACPSPSPIMPFKSKPEKKKDIYLLQTCSADRAGLINDLTQVLWELEVQVDKVNALTSPDGHAVDVFYLSDNRPSKRRQELVSERIKSVLGSSQSFCELSLISENEFNEHSDLGMSSMIPDELFGERAPSAEPGALVSGSGYDTPKFSINIDNSLSPGHTLLQITFQNRRGILYDCLRVLRDLNLQIAYGRFSTTPNNTGDLDLFILQANGNKLVDPDKQNSLLNRLRMDMCDPIRVMMVNRGPDTELLVATTVEKNGRVRPRILYDVTLVLKMLDICIFKAESEKISHGERLWEVYRFLLIDKANTTFRSARMRSQIIQRVKSVLMG